MSNTIPTIQKDNYVHGVSFDTMTDQDQPDLSFVLRGKSKGYKRSVRSRTFLVATDLANHSEYALTWVIENLLSDGDEIVVLRVLTIDMNDNRPNMEAFLRHEELQAKEKASAAMKKIMAISNDDLKISVVIEFVIGKVQKTIQNVISTYQPSMLIVGTRGISELKGMFMNSISKYCLQHSPVPVIVVRPEEVIKKQSQKKQQKKSNRLSGIFRLNISDNSDSSSSDEEDLNNIDKKVQRLSVFDRIGRRSRSPSPAKPQTANSKTKK